MTCDAIIIGGGITGLTAAFRLRQRGLAPVVMDSASPGGLIRSRLEGGFSLELGANTLVLTPQTEELLVALGLQGAIRLPAIERYRQYVEYHGSIIEVPKSPPKFLTSPLFSATEKIAVLKGLGRKLRPAEISSTETIADFFSRLLGPAPATKVIAPVLRGIFGGDINQLRASAVFPKLFSHLATGGTLFSYGQSQKVLRRKIFCLAGGNASLCRELSNALTGSIKEMRATSIHRQSDLFQVHLEDGTSIEAPYVLVATAGSATAPLLTRLSPEASAAALALNYAPIVALHFSIPRSSKLPPDAFGVLFPPTTGSNLLGIMFNSIIFPHVAPPTEHLLTLCFGGVGGEAILEKDDAELHDIALGEIRRRLQIDSAHVLSVQRWPHAIPQYDRHHGDLIERYAALERSMPGLYFIGADIGGVGVPNRIERAFDAADRIMSQRLRN